MFKRESPRINMILKKVKESRNTNINRRSSKGNYLANLWTMPPYGMRGLEMLVSSTKRIQNPADPGDWFN